MAPLLGADNDVMPPQLAEFLRRRRRSEGAHATVPNWAAAARYSVGHYRQSPTRGRASPRGNSMQFHIGQKVTCINDRATGLGALKRSAVLNNKSLDAKIRLSASAPTPATGWPPPSWCASSRSPGSPRAAGAVDEVLAMRRRGKEARSELRWLLRLRDTPVDGLCRA